MKYLSALFQDVSPRLKRNSRRNSKRKQFVRASACLFLFAAGFAALLAGTTKIAAQSRSDSPKPPVSGPQVIITFGTGSLIIPMHDGSNAQNSGMLRAYGLVYALLRNRVPVNWVINPTKGESGADFQTTPANALQDVRTGAPIPPISYSGGPFVIAAADAAAALSIIQPWQATAGDQTTVHRVGSGSFTVNVARALVSAPRIGILKDGFEEIAFQNLNSDGVGLDGAGIPDSTGALWSAASPDLLTQADVAGSSMSNHSDGVLFNGPGGLSRYCYIAAMHYDSTTTTPAVLEEVVHEFRSALASASLGHAFMQCEAIRAFENATAGLFLTNAGLDDDGAATLTPVVRVPADPLAQLFGPFEVDMGAVDSMRANDAPGATPDYKPGVSTLINESSALLTQRIVMLHGRLDGLPTTGQVTYLAGHDYSVSLPISTNPQTNGVRLFLNSIFESDCAIDAGQPDVTLTKSAPAMINGSTISYTINYSNPGPRPAENIRLTDKLPAGATYVAGSGVPAPTTNAGGVLTWNLPPLASGAMATVTFQVSVSADGPYSNTAQMGFAHLTVRQISSNTVVTVRDTVPPTVVITAGPSGATNDNTPTFMFTTSGGAVSTLCAIDNGSFTPCSESPSSYTSAPLTDGPHTFTVQATDAAGNTASASRSFTVDTVSPIVDIPGPPTNPNPTNDSTPDLFFNVMNVPPTTPIVSTQCRVDSDAFAPCTSPFTPANPLSVGPHFFEVLAVDAASNAGSDTYAFEVSNPNQCVVCHRGLTLTLPCNSLEYRRHVDHGDTAGACQARSDVQRW